MKNILFRADSSSDVGLGHIMRDMVLAKAYEKEGDKVSFASRNLEGNIIDKIHYMERESLDLQANGAHLGQIVDSKDGSQGQVLNFGTPSKFNLKDLAMNLAYLNKFKIQDLTPTPIPQ